MRRAAVPFALALSFLLAGAAPAFAQKVYRCTDARGQPVFQQSACAAASAPAAAASSAAAPAPARAASGAREPRPCYSEREVDSVRSAASSPTIGRADRERLTARVREMERCRR